MAQVARSEKLLNYSRGPVGAYDGVAQQRSWDCGPASVQIILQANGINVDEQTLIDKIGTTVNGTNHAGLACPVLNEYLPGSGYVPVWLPREPVPGDQVEALWSHITKSVDAGRGVLLNFEAPPNNFPKGSNGSSSPEYRGFNTIFHYVAGMGYATDDFGNRHVWIADPGFRPFGYYITLQQCATLIVPHAYAWASTAPALPGTPSSSPSTPPAPPVPPTPTTPSKRYSWSDLIKQIWKQFRG